MKISVLDAEALRRALPQLIAKHDQIFMAVAWAHAGLVAEKLIKNKHKFKSVTVGLDFCATDPNFVDSLCNVPNAYVFKKNGVCFHPKIYLFVTGQNADAIVGSANFTTGGLGTNVEACLHLNCNVDEAVISELLAALESYAPHRQPVTEQLADSYRLQAGVVGSRPRPRSPVLPSDKADFARVDSELLKMDWSTFIREARKDPNHHFETRMRFLRYLQTLFAREQSFNSLSVSEWKAVAGIVHPDAVAGSGLEKHQIGWFGSMQGAGSFTKLISIKDSRIAKAIDCIPRRGPVAESDFDRFCELFVSAFANSARTGSTPTATRLLAMKRPDLFICVNKGNKASLAEALHFAPSTLHLDNYWKRVIEPIRLAKWYNAPRPEGADAEAWDCRAALVDAIYYKVV
ncbi:hypothetical protein HH303_03865 [Rhodospirillaceae bacterium KN72]|uniref:Phospholipase D-like domain-containing protein n=1 Tax=Pacificispira spongiicola TaxID=2729598 RepID=A0A7Y0DXV2_9PROT|nr:phospholipase D family protein [Pacificispira spongiicola]NMM43600.1 hypothetical protein [Pacificispira spongiicola]